MAASNIVLGLQLFPSPQDQFSPDAPLSARRLEVDLRKAPLASLLRPEAWQTSVPPCGHTCMSVRRVRFFPRSRLAKRFLSRPTSYKTSWARRKGPPCFSFSFIIFGGLTAPFLFKGDQFSFFLLYRFNRFPGKSTSLLSPSRSLCFLTITLTFFLPNRIINLLPSAAFN